MRWIAGLRRLAGLEDRPLGPPIVYLWHKERVRMYVAELHLPTGDVSYRVDIDVRSDKGDTSVASINEVNVDAAIELLQQAKARIALLRE